MSILLWAHAQGSGNKVLTSDLVNLFKGKILVTQNQNGRWNQKAVLGFGENIYASAISLIGLIKAGLGGTLPVHKAAKWLAEQQATSNILDMGDDSVLWPATSMNRTNSLRNDRFVSDIATSYASLALQLYRNEVLVIQ